MLDRLDHLVYAVPDLDAAVELLGDSFGVRAAAGGSHPGRGTRNALLALGPRCYLEIIGPDPEQPEPALSGRVRPFGVGGSPEPRLVTWAVQESDPAARAARLERAGYPAGEVREMTRRRPDGVELAWRLSMPPRDDPGGGVVPFLIDWGATPHPACDAPRGCTLLGLEIWHPRPDRVAAWYRALGVDLEVQEGAAPRLRARIDTPRGARTLE